MARTVLVTGGGGFIGSNLVRALLERGDTVKVLDNFSTGNRANLAGLDVEVIEGELRCYERVHNAVRGVEVVFHLGALGSVPRSVQDPLTSSAVNVEGTLNVLLAARDSGVRRVVYSSSTSVYGTSAPLPTPETAPADPISPYGVAKLAAERYCVELQPGLRVVRERRPALLQRLRPAAEPVLAVRGGRARASSRRSPPGEPITIHGDGRQSRDFTYVGNCVDATLAAAEARDASGRIFNVAGGRPASVNDVADMIGADPRQAGREDARTRRARGTSATRGPT